MRALPVWGRVRPRRTVGGELTPSCVALHDEPRDLLVLREPVQAGLGEDPPPVEVDLEDAPAGRHERELDPGERRAELGGQTVRLRGVVSLRAVFDADVHGGWGSRGAERRRGGERALVEPCFNLGAPGAKGEIVVRSTALGRIC